tara:strand:+ start:2831 stop:3094 length:264 start_codon:yes stop_codon:yes gene_type:complete
MTVKTNHGKFEVNGITFKQRRQLHRYEVAAINNDGSMISDKFFDVLECVSEIAFTNAEESLSKYKDNEIDEILIAIYNAYREPSKKK